MAVTIFYFLTASMAGDVDKIVKLILDALNGHAYPQQRLDFLPEPQGQGSFLPTLVGRGLVDGADGAPPLRTRQASKRTMRPMRSVGAWS